MSYRHYTLQENLCHATRKKGPIVTFKNKWLSIQRCDDYTLIKVTTGYSWDGCTGAPNVNGTKWASCLHDAIYQFSEDIAEHTGWTVKQVTDWGNEVFLERMIQDDAPVIIAALYYHVTRFIGYPFHIVARWIRALIGI